MFKISLSKKNQLIVLLSILAVLSVLYITLSIKTRPPISTPPPSLPFQVQPTFIPKQEWENLSQQTINIPPQLFPNLPKLMSIPRATLSSNSPTRIASQLAQIFNLINSKEIDLFWNNPDKSSYLAIDNQKIIYRGHSDSENSIPKLESSITVGQELLSRLGYKNMSAQRDKVVYFLDKHGEVVPSSANDYNFISIPFGEFINNLPVTEQNNNFPTAEMLFGYGDVITKLTIYHPPFEIGSELTQLPIITESELRAVVKQGKAVPLAYEMEQSGKSVYNQFGPVTVNSIEIEYKYVSGLNLLMPYFMLNGKTTTSDRVVTKVTFIIPAISEEELAKLGTQIKP